MATIPGASSAGGVLTSATTPKSSPRSAKFVKSGRKLSVTATSQHLLSKKESPQKKKPKPTENASVEELDRMLEEDALALLNIKKEISGSQQNELLKVKAAVMNIKKEHDALHMANNIKERQLSSYKDREIQLRGVEQASYSTAAAVQEKVDDFNDQTAQVLEDLAAEQRSIKMLTMMMKRLDSEIGECRVDTAKAVIQVDHAKHDVSISDANLVANRQELAEQEQKLDKLAATIKSRKDQREQKINMLQNLSLDGENSVAKLQESLMETNRLSRSRARSRSQQAAARLGRSTASRHRSAGTGAGGALLGSAGLGLGDLDDEFADLAEGASSFKRFTPAMVQEIINRHSSQEARMDKLKQLDAELRANISTQLKKKQEFSDHLAHTVFRIQQLASSRQIYQEVDLKDSALAATSKECDDCKEKDFRLRVNIETLKQAIPRFLNKVTKETHVPPNENQLGDAIVKLEDELTKLIKTIGSALLKDATPEDLALMSQQSAVGVSGVGGSAASEAQSEFGRLQRLPGYSRLQRQLFFNLMTAKPDISKQNVRVDQFGKVKKPKSTSGSTALVSEALPNRSGSTRGSPYKPAISRTAASFNPHGSVHTIAGGKTDSDLLAAVTPGGGVSISGGGGGGSAAAMVSATASVVVGMDEDAEEEEDETDDALNRETIKNISQLIYEDAHKKAGSVASADTINALR